MKQRRRLFDLKNYTRNKEYPCYFSQCLIWLEFRAGLFLIAWSSSSSFGLKKDPVLQKLTYHKSMHLTSALFYFYIILKFSLISHQNWQDYNIAFCLKICPIPQQGKMRGGKDDRKHSMEANCCNIEQLYLINLASSLSLLPPLCSHFIGYLPQNVSSLNKCEWSIKIAVPVDLLWRV